MARLMDWQTTDIDAIVESFCSARAPGCAVGIVQNDELVFAKGYGTANLEHDVEITPDSVFDVGSVTKQFTAATVLLLADAGALSLDDAVRDYLPSLPQDPFGDVSIRHLIHHTSGIPDYLVLMAMSGRSWDNDYPEDELIDLIARQRELDFRPGSAFSYSNSGYLILAEIVRAASGQSLRTAAQEHIFGPAGMTDTFFHDDFAEVVPRRATGYTPILDGGWRIDAPTIDVVGDGGLFTTVRDLAKWQRQFSECTLAGGPGFIDRLTTPGTLTDGTNTTYAFGLFRDSYRGRERIQHGGSWGGYRAQVLRLPQDSMSVIVLANVSSPPVTDLANAVTDVVLGDRLSPVAPDLSTSVDFDVTPYLGNYVDDRASCVLEIASSEGGGPVIGFSGVLLPARPTSPSTLKIPRLDAQLHLVNAETAVLDSPIRALHIELRRIAEPPLNPQPLDHLAGRYRSEELAVHCEIAVLHETLTLRIGWLDWLPLEQLSAGLFRSRDVVVRFEHEAGRPVALTLGQPRARSQRFTRA
jgi:CubicO group peptidase (beta-lactamase class C family)